MKARFLVVDYNPEAISHLEEAGVTHEYGDITDPEFLDEMGIEQAKLVISTIRDFEANLFLTDHVHTANPDAVIIAHTDNPEHASLLYERGATYVMMPHYIGSERISNMINRVGLNKSDFIASREKHIRYVQNQLK